MTTPTVKEIGLGISAHPSVGVELHGTAGLEMAERIVGHNPLGNEAILVTPAAEKAADLLANSGKLPELQIAA